MRKLEELIERLCPNGVEYKCLSDITKALKKGTLKTTDLVNDGKYPVINSGREIYGHYNNFNNEGNAITFAARGEYAGVINYFNEKFWAGGLCYPYTSIDENKLNTKYLYYFLKSKEKHIMETLVARGSIPALNKSDLDKYKVVVPPLEVQCEIVHILDDFTELSAELSAELKARQKQYEYYRNKLLNNNGEMTSLKNIIKKSCSGGTPLKSNNEYYENGNIPWLRTQDVRFNEIKEVDSFITEKAVNETSAKWIPENCVIVAISGASAGRCAINKFKTTTNQHCLNMEIDENKALYKYVFYSVCSKHDELISMKQGARGDLNSSKILSLKIPLPKIEEQKRIVEVLERFDKLCNSISEGLPAEIEARQKQYEYYRDKLLNFKELKQAN